MKIKFKKEAASLNEYSIVFNYRDFLPGPCDLIFENAIKNDF